MHTVAITGATGFLGRHLLAGCLDQAGFALRLLTRDPAALGHLCSDRVTLCQGDLLQPETLQGFLQPGCTLVHLAYLRGAPDANIDAVRFLAEAAKGARVKRVVHCSTAVVVGFSAGGTVTEETAPAPADTYQQAKYEIEQILRATLPAAIELAILRPTEIIGPGGQGLQQMIDRLDNEKWYVRSLYHRVLKSRRFNYVSVHNVVAALILLVSSPVPQMREIYNISDDDDPDNYYAAVEQIVHSSLGISREYHLDFGLPRPLLALLFKLLPGLAPPHRIYSRAKLDRLGYMRVVTLREAISEVVSTQRGSPARG